MSNLSNLSVSASLNCLARAAVFALGLMLIPSFAADQRAAGTFTLRSPEVTDGGTLPRDYTGDGTSSTLPLEWSNAPAGTKSFAIIMHHVPPDGGFKWYWVLYNIPADTQSLPKNVKGIGTLGNNSVNRRLEYAPPHSKGPGPKTYIYTVYALSAPPQITVPSSDVNREVLLAAMKDKILASAELRVVYSRPEGATSDNEGRGPGIDLPRK
ncbi:MAG: YbhB/YbcL family Raf kinase inhibitor-like protein [Verrucomicrobiota bacterium]